MVLLS